MTYCVLLSPSSMYMRFGQIQPFVNHSFLQLPQEQCMLNWWCRIPYARVRLKAERLRHAIVTPCSQISQAPNICSFWDLQQPHDWPQWLKWFVGVHFCGPWYNNKEMILCSVASLHCLCASIAYESQNEYSSLTLWSCKVSFGECAASRGVRHIYRWMDSQTETETETKWRRREILNSRLLAAGLSNSRQV